MTTLKWKKAATREEIKRVAEIDRRILRSTKGVNALKAERRAIVLRCGVRSWRKSQ